jgi:hypothetical protein
MNDSLDKLVKSVSRITDLYEMNEETTNSNQDRQLSSDRPTSPVFLSQISQDEYNTMTITTLPLRSLISLGYNTTLTFVHIPQKTIF